MSHILTLWTNDPTRAEQADRAGVDRIGLDLECIGKEIRQSGHPTWISDHTLDDLPLIAPKLKNAELFARTNPLNIGSRDEIELLLEHGVCVLMLPYFTNIGEVEDFVQIVRGRATIVPLLERVAAVDCIPKLPDIGISEFHVGLNDISIELGFTNRLEALVSPVVDRIFRQAHDCGLKIGVGGLGRAEDNDLPVPADLIYAQQSRLGSSAAMIARSFFRESLLEIDLTVEIQRLRARLDKWLTASPSEIMVAHEQLLTVLRTPTE